MLFIWNNATYDLIKFLVLVMDYLLLFQPFIATIIPYDDNRDWYAKLNKPKLTPPPITFPIVWTLLYLSLGYIAIINKKSSALWWVVYELQLLLNFAWSPVYFGRKDFKNSFKIIIAMIIATGLLFVLSNNYTRLLLFPYSIWLLFASYLNYEILKLNNF